MDEWTPLGSHRYRVENGILLLETNGEFTDEDLRRYLTIFRQFAAADPTFAVLADVRRGVSSSPEVRKHASVALRSTDHTVPIVVVGANLAVRTLFTLFANAQRLITGTPSNGAFFASIEQAREWLALKRAELPRTGSPVPPSS